MPSISNLTITKYDNTTNIVFDGLVGAGMDGQEALWRQDTGNSLPVRIRPTFTVKTKWNGPKTARQYMAKARFPFGYLDSTTGLYDYKDMVYGELLIVNPISIPLANQQEAISQMLKLFAGSTSQPLSTAVQLQSAITGYAPT